MNREIEARLKISAVDRTGKVLKGVGDKLGYINQRADSFNRSQGLFARNMEQMLTTVARYAAPAALGWAAVYSTKQAAKFEESLFAIQKKSGATTEQMGKLRDEIMQLGTEVPVTLEEVASAFERGAAAGVPLDELKQFSKLTAGVADAWDTTSETTANYFAGFSAGMGIARKDLQAYASLINDLADAGIADETGIADFIDRAGASLKNFGMTPEEIAAYGAALLNLKMPAEVGARAMDTLTGKLLAPENLSDKSFNALEEIVGSMKDFSKLAGNAKLQFFLKQVEKLSSQRRASLLGALLGEGFDDEIMRLISGTQEVERNLEMAARHMRNPSNSIAEAQAKKLELFNSQLQIMKTNLQEVAVEVGDNILPSLTAVAKSINETLSSGRAIDKAVEGMSAEEQKQQFKWFFDRYVEANKDQPFAESKAMVAYDQALQQIGRGDIRNVSEYIDRLKAQGRYRDRKNASSVGRQGQPIPRDFGPEFPGGDRNLDPYNLPATGVPIPGDRNAMTKAQLRTLKDQMAYYNAGRVGQRTLPRNVRGDLLKMADPASIGMEGMGGVLIEGGEKAGQKIAEGGREGADFFTAAAQAIVAAGASAAQAIRQAAQEVQRQNMSRAGGAIGALVNANTGQTMPPSAGRPAGQGPR